MSEIPAQLHAQNQPAVAVASTRARRMGLLLLLLAGGAILLFLSFYHLTQWPATWFDEGLHLHVPKTLVQEGVYADRSSEGYRFFGPTVGVGPTVMLPVALAFRVAGVGLLQARVVMALYLLATLVVFYLLARRLAGNRFALIAVTLLAATRGIALFEYGRQMLGEVPALFFLILGIMAWYSAWDRESPTGRLLLAGLLIGLSLVTKIQNLLIVAPGLLLVWIFNIVYYRAVPQRAFIITGAAAAITVTVWQVFLIFFLSPASAAENFAQLRAASAGAAFVFSTNLMRHSISEIFSPKAYFSLLLPFVAYGMTGALPRSREGLRWSVIATLVVVNLVWYVFASIGWWRYVFVALALSALLAARLFEDLLAATPWRPMDWLRTVAKGQRLSTANALSLLASAGLFVMVSLPLAVTALHVIRPPEAYAAETAAYLNEHIETSTLIETWEPEVGFLTDHRYHYPPNEALNAAVSFAWLGGAPPAESYAFVEESQPPYILVGNFARSVDMYGEVIRKQGYLLERTFGPYELYRNPAAPILERAAQP